MQLRAEHIVTIVAIIAPIVFTGMIYFMPYMGIMIPKVVANIGFGVCFIIFSGAMLALTPVGKKLFRIHNDAPIPSVLVSNYSSIIPDNTSQISPRNRPPLFFDVLLLISMTIIFTFGISMMYMWISGKLTAMIGFGQMFLFTFSIVAPILAFVDVFYWQRRQYKLGRSSVYKDKIIKIDGDKNKVFDTCFEILDTVPKSTILESVKPKSVRALIGEYIITVIIKSIRNKKVEIHIESDSVWMTTRIDWGVNQRGINKLDRLIRAKIGQGIK